MRGRRGGRVCHQPWHPRPSCACARRFVLGAAAAPCFRVSSLRRSFPCHLPLFVSCAESASLLFGAIKEQSRTHYQEYCFFSLFVSYSFPSLLSLFLLFFLSLSILLSFYLFYFYLYLSSLFSKHLSLHSPSLIPHQFL